MADHIDTPAKALTRQKISDAVTGRGWRYVLGAIRTSVPVPSLARGTEVAAQIVAVAAGDADGHLWLDVRADRVLISAQSRATSTVTARDIALAHRISSTVSELGLVTEPGRPPGVQTVELGIDALDIAAVRPFWKAVLGYVDPPGWAGPEDPIIDPLELGPAIWFQQMDAPRPQRNRIHFDVSVPHDAAAGRLRAALDAGGVLVSDSRASAFWVLADAEGNEVCICTWQDRD